MSWLNLNDSLNSIKGQLSNFASGVLADGITDEADVSNGKKVEELEGLVSSQSLEIETLRKQNQELQGKLSTKRQSLNGSDSGDPEKRDDWFWDPYDQDNADEKTPIAELKRKIRDLEDEKKELITSLEQLDLDCQQTTEKIVNLKDALQVDYNTLQQKYTELQRENATSLHTLQELRKEKANLLTKVEELEEAALEDQNGKLKESQEYVELQQEENGALGELGKMKTKVEDLEAALIDRDGQLKEYQQSRAIDQKEFQKLAKILQGYEEQVTTYKNQNQQLMLEQELLHQRHLDLLRENFKKFIGFDLIVEENAFSAAVEAVMKILLDFKEKFENAEENHRDLLKETFKKFVGFDLEVETATFVVAIETVLKMLVDFKLKSESAEENQMVHRRYVNLLTESFRKFMDFDLVVEDKKEVIPHSDERTSEFIIIVEAILKMLLDLKWKTETLRKEVDDLTAEKTKILTEKNYEIEKLINNSEILSQEVITKSQALKHYEAECAALIKNNDMLIVELESYKNSPGLQTISESNEDNLLLLESQLENANKRIKSLEITISDLENSKQEANLEMQSELEYIKKQLNLTGTELSQIKQDYQRLHADYNQLQDNKSDLTELYEVSVTEKQNLTSKLDKMQTEFENTEYRYSEINIDMESLKEETEVLKTEINDLTKTNNRMAEQHADFECRNELLQNEIDDLKQQLISEIESKQQQEFQIRNLTEKLQNSKMAETSLKLQNDTLMKEWRNLAEAKDNLEIECSRLRNENVAKLSEEKEKSAQLELINQLQAANEGLLVKLKLADEEISNLKSDDLKNLNSNLLEKVQESNDTIKALEAHVIELNQSRNELINLVTTKHQESLQYHAEIQRLNHVLTVETERAKTFEEQLKNLGSKLENAEELAKKKEEIDRLTDQNNFLREKCELLAQNLLREQSAIQKCLAEKNNATSEREATLSKELERLRVHLLEIEETYTKELLAAENRNQEMQAKVNEIEQREKDSSTLYTSVNIRTNQQVETLQNQLQMVTSQRDELRKKISDAEDRISKQSAALSNLQFVLEQFQKDKEKDVYLETERIRRQINAEKKVQQELQDEISSLKSQLSESKQGLLAASRLTEQLENSKQQLANMKEEVSKLQQKLAQSEAKFSDLISQTDSKVDKLLIKNLVVGFASANPNFNKDQQQILKLIATVLDFNQQDNEKIHLNKQPQGSWLSSILHPQAEHSANEVSLSQAFVRFLENESKPRELPNLLDSNKVASNNVERVEEASKTSSPILLSEVVLPTFADFGQNRNSSSILKDVLKNNN